MSILPGAMARVQRQALLTGVSCCELTVREKVVGSNWETFLSGVIPMSPTNTSRGLHRVLLRSLCCWHTMLANHAESEPLWPRCTESGGPVRQRGAVHACQRAVPWGH